MNKSDNDSTDFCTALEIVYNPEVSLNDYQHLVPHFLHSSWTSLGDIPSNLARYGKAEVLEYLNFFHRNLEQTPADRHASNMALLQSPRSDEEAHQHSLYYLCLALYEIHIAIESGQRIDETKDYSVSQANGIIQALQALIHALSVSEPMDIIERRSAWDFGEKVGIEKAGQKYSEIQSNNAQRRTELPKEYWSIFDKVVERATSQDTNNILRIKDVAEILYDFFIAARGLQLGFKWKDSYQRGEDWLKDNLKTRLKTFHATDAHALYLSKTGRPAPKLVRDNLKTDIGRKLSKDFSFRESP